MARKIIKWLIALLGGVIGYGLVLLVTSLIKFEFPKLGYEIATYAAAVILFFIIFYLSSEFFIDRVRKLIDKLDSDIKKLSVLDVILGTVGLLIGLGLSYIAVKIISGIKIPIVVDILSVIIYITVIMVSVGIAVRRKDDLEAYIRKYKSAGTEASKKFLDTSVIIDGRILDALRTGFIDGDLIVPSFVLEELQFIADSADSMRREKGRRGLDILNQMTHEFKDQVRVVDYEKDKKTTVDLALLELTKKEGGVVMTIDYNLNKVAGVKSIRVLNINDLSAALMPVVLPGERFDLQIVRQGKEAGQGVGFLNDGTMVVVEDGSGLVDTIQHVEVTSVLQTSAGRMIFVKIA